MQNRHIKAAGATEEQPFEASSGRICAKTRKKSNWRNLAAHNTYIFASNFNFNSIQL